MFHDSSRTIPAALLVLAPFIVSAGPLAAGAEQAKTTYVDHVRPILRQHCAGCHGQGRAQNDLRVDDYDALMEGGVSGAAIAPGDLDGSYLWSLVAHLDQPNMPPNQDKLPDEQLSVIEQWILGGALKDSGSVAKVKKNPALEMAMSAVATGAVREGVMPTGLSTQSLVETLRPGPVTALAASPWAPLVAVAGQQQIALYHAETHDLLGVLPFPEGIPYTLAFSRSGSLLLAGGGHAAQRGLAVVYDVKTGKRLFEVGDELDAVLAADINRDQTLIALGGPQRLVRVYHTSDGSLAYEITKHTDWIYAARFSPDGVLLATGDRSGGLWVWEAGTGREFHDLAAHKAAVTDLAWRPDSNVLASASEDGTAKLWGMEAGNQIKSVSAHRDGVLAVDFGRDGRWATGGRDGVAKLWKPDGSALRTFKGFSELVLKLAFTHDASGLVAGDYAGEICLMNTADGASQATWSTSPPSLPPPVEGALAELQAEADRAVAAMKAAREQMRAAQGEEAVATARAALLEAAVAEQLALMALEDAKE